MKLSVAIAEYEKFLKLRHTQHTSNTYLEEVKRLCIALKNPDLHLITAQDITDHLSLHKELGWSHNGIVNKCVHIRALWRWLNVHNYVTFNYNAIPIMRKEWVAPRVATEEEYKKVIAFLSKPKAERNVLPFVRNKAITMLLWDTGCRAGELADIEMKDVDLKKMKALIKTKKSRGKRPVREIYWTKETSQALKEWIKYKEDIEMREDIENSHMLFWQVTNNSRGKKISTQTITSFLYYLSKEAKLKRIVNAHSFRHHMGRSLSLKGANNSIISSILGHSSLASSYIYTEMNDVDREKAYVKFVRGLEEDKKGSHSEG